MQLEMLYNAMFRRESVRKYAPDPLPGQLLGEIQDFIGEIPSLTGEGTAKVCLLTPTQMSKGIKAPHYAAAYAADDTLSRLEAGYLLEYLNLYLFGMGIGSCYNGMAKPHSQYSALDELPYQIAMAMGTPEGTVGRTGPSAFRRKSLAAVADTDVPIFLAEAVRVAPSAVNVQPWFLGGGKEMLEVYYSPRGLVAKMTGSYANIDIGIALCHLRIAAEKQGMACTFDFDVQSPATAQKRELICRVKIS